MSEIDAIGQYFAAAREAELKEQMFERRVRAIAREEIEAAKEPMPKVYVVKTTPINQEGGEANSSLRRNVGEDKSPPAVEAPAAGDPKEMAGRLRNIARDPNNFIPRAGSLIEAAVMIEDTTALARRLAESLAEARDRLLVASKDAAGSAYAYQMAGKAAQAHYLDQHRAALDILLDRLNPALTEARKVGLIE